MEKLLREEGCKELGLGTKRWLPKDQKRITEFSVTQSMFYSKAPTVRTFPADRVCREGTERLN